MGGVGRGVILVVGLVGVLSAAAMVEMYFNSVSTDSYVDNLNHYWCCFG